MSKQDPKHGRWILPLVVLALVLFTFTFVNNLPPAETPTTTTAAASERTTTTAPPEETTTTTQLAPEVVAFVATLDSLAAEAASLREDAQTINDDYAVEVAGYGATRDALSDLRVRTNEFADSVEAIQERDEVPEAAAQEWTDITTAASAMVLEAENMFDGLVNTAGSETRLTALENYNIAAATFSQNLDDAKEAAMATPEAEDEG